MSFTGKGPDAIIEIGDPKIGDCIRILDTGAYGLSMSSQYNLREIPAEILVNKKNVEMIRRRQDFKDLVVNFNWFDRQN
jgi:Diaminopimelate decarboxylase